MVVDSNGTAGVRPAEENTPVPLGGLVPPAWRERLARARQERQAEASPAVVAPRSPARYRGGVTLIGDGAAAQAALDLARQRPVGWAGVATECRHARPGVALDRCRTAHDPSGIRPLLLALALAEPQEHAPDVLYRFAVDLRREEVLPAVRELFGLPLRIVGHDLGADLLCLGRLGVPEPRQLWDTLIGEKALQLGRHHRKYAGGAAGDASAAAASERAREDEARRNSLAAVCGRHAVPFPFAGDEARVRRSFLEHPTGAPFTAAQLEYASARAVAAAGLYLPQVQAAARAGGLAHLEQVEMPWVATNARMTARGVLRDEGLCRRARATAVCHRRTLKKALAEHGVANGDSHAELARFFAARGLLELFRRGGEVSFDKAALEEAEGRHPAVRTLRALRRVDSLLECGVLRDEFVGLDGRLHPVHVQLGSHTGRQTCWGPNLLGLGRVFRPLLVAPDGFGIGEVDLCQIEAGVAGAVYGDGRLVAMYNSGHVYEAMALAFHGGLPESDRGLPAAAFKEKHPGLRSRMKACTLSMIYGGTARGLARRLDCDPERAGALLGEFAAAFPGLRRALEEAPQHDALRGYAAAATGLRRRRADGGSGPGRRERNWMVNFPVQGGAAAAFKAAGSRLDRLYRPFGARLLIPLHDSYVFEAPLGALREVAELTARVMCEAVAELFPELRPRAEINISHPARWNKDGCHDSVERWLEDPLFRL
jgi:DNA polymerase-1